MRHPHFLCRQEVNRQYILVSRQSYSLLVVVSVAPPPLSATPALSAATSSFVSAAAAFTLSTPALLPVSTPAALLVMAAAALLPVGHTATNQSTHPAASVQ